MGEQFLFDNFGLPILLWAGLYISDYYLTLYGVKLYHGGAKNHVVIEGSYELNPAFQQEIDARRQISSRFILSLFAVVVLLLTVRGLVGNLGLGERFSFAFVLVSGALILVSAGVHVRHIRNIVSFRFYQRGEGVQGKIEYARWLSLLMSSVEFLTFTIIFGVLALLLQSWFFLGGAVGCARVAFQHWQLSRKARNKEAQTSPQKV